MTSVLDTISFPALWIGTDGSMGAVSNVGTLLGLTRGTLRFYENLRLVDAAGNSYRIDHASLSQGKGLRTALVRWFGKPKRVHDLYFREGPVPLNLAAFKELVVRTIATHRPIWESAGNLDELLMAIQSAGSHRRIVELLL